jgi:hypothetical protein
MMIRPWPGAIVFGVGIISVAATIYYYVHWARRDPDRLQTEDFRIKDKYYSKMPEIIELYPDHMAPRDSTVQPKKLSQSDRSGGSKS